MKQNKKRTKTHEKEEMKKDFCACDCCCCSECPYLDEEPPRRRGES